MKNTKYQTSMRNLTAIFARTKSSYFTMFVDRFQVRLINIKMEDMSRFLLQDVEVMLPLLRDVCT